MSIQELETAIKKLSTKELASLTSWLIDYHEKIWDQQIEEDLDSGKLDQLLDEIDSEYEAGLAKSL
jgi:BioD-like phosphotransacetylase family protein